MGVLKAYNAGIALKSFSAACFSISDGFPTSPGVTVPAFKTMAGRDFTQLATGSLDYLSYNLSLYSFFKSFYASTEGIENFDKTKYAPTGVGTTAFSCVGYPALLKKNYIVTVANNSDAEIEVKSFQITKEVWAYNNPPVKQECLLYAYYLDEPVTIQPGDAKSIVITFDFS